jgi:hypothetical protein
MKLDQWQPRFHRDPAGEVVRLRTQLTGELGAGTTLIARVARYGDNRRLMEEEVEDWEDRVARLLADRPSAARRFMRPVPASDGVVSSLPARLDHHVAVLERIIDELY